MRIIRSIWNGLDWSYLTGLLWSVIPILICMTIHELAHGLVAYKLGDDTAKRSGRLSLNPLKHIDVWGFIMMLFFGFGYAKPVAVNMMNFKHPKRGMALTALAGPVSNFLLAFVVLLIFGFVYPVASQTVLYDILARTAVLSISLGLFNLIPIPPLDGSKVVFSLLSDEGYFRLMRYERYGMLILFVILITGILDRPLMAAVNFVFRLLFQGAWGIASIFYG